LQPSACPRILNQFAQISGLFFDLENTLRTYSQALELSKKDGSIACSLAKIIQPSQGSKIT